MVAETQAAVGKINIECEMGIEELKQLYSWQLELNKRYPGTVYRVLGVVPEEANQSPQGLSKYFENKLFSLNEMISTHLIDGHIIATAQYPIPTE